MNHSPVKWLYAPQHHSLSFPNRPISKSYTLYLLPHLPCTFYLIYLVPFTLNTIYLVTLFTNVYRVDHFLMAPGEKAVLAPKGLAERTHSDALDALGAPRPRFRGEGPLTRRSYCARVVPGALTSTSTLKYNHHIELGVCG